MPSASFALKDPKSKVSTPINLLFRYNSTRVKVSTKEAVEPQYWNKKKKRVIQTNEVFNFQEINNNLARIEAKSLEIFEGFVSQYKREPETSELKLEFDRLLFDENEEIGKESRHKTFFDFFEAMIKVRGENKKVSNERILTYKRTLTLLKEFQKSKKVLIAFENFNEDFSVQFREFLEKEKEFSPNTINKNFRVLRAVLNSAFQKNYNVDKEYKSKDFMPETEDSYEIALSIEEVEKLYRINFAFNPRLERVRDLFIIACFTGLRFSDIIRLKKENLKGEYLSVVMEKTKKKNPLPIVIPILDIVREIFIKYDYNLPNNITNQKMNEYLKELAEMSGIFNDTVEYMKTKGGITTKVQNPKWMEISTHTARRTFCTMSYKIGVPTQSLMKISGHLKETSFLRYLRVTNEEHAERTKGIWENYFESNKSKLGITVKLEKI